MRLEDYLKPELTLVLESVAERSDLFRRLSEAAGGAGVDASRLESALGERESKAPTSTPEGVAFPHALLEGVSDTIVIAARVPGGVAFGKSDHPPSDVIFCMIGSSLKPWDHVRLLARIARIARGAGALDRLRKSSTGAELYAALVEEDRSHG